MNIKSTFVCQQCGYSQTGWSGKCPECGVWGSLVETVVSTQNQKSLRARGKNQGKALEPVLLTSIPPKATSRITTKISELDRVLGGGLVSGQVVLIAGEPGIGKSTLLLQVADSLGNFLYISGEESLSQLKIRADRLGIKNKTINLLEETDIDSVVNYLTAGKNNLKGVIVDSIQTMATSDLSGMAGSVGQVRECTFRLVRCAKEKNIPVFLVGHVTKEGTVAGPSILMHIVDTVLWFEGDKSLTFRLLRAVKNRFGPTDEIGIFSMEDRGLVSQNAPEKLFLSEDGKTVAGHIVASVLQGTRPLLVEIQSLVVPTRLAFPKRIAQGIEARRFELMLAVLQRRAGLPLGDFDCYVNVTGGISIKGDPSCDLAVCLAVASAYLDKPHFKGSVAIGEVGLLGDIREVIAQAKRVKEAKRLGFRVTITSKEVQNLQDAIRKYLR